MHFCRKFSFVLIKRFLGHFWPKFGDGEHLNILMDLALQAFSHFIAANTISQITYCAPFHLFPEGCFQATQNRADDDPNISEKKLKTIRKETAQQLRKAIRTNLNA